MMKDMQQRMGYDRSITMFSPDGRLLQVEYAKKTVHQGSTAMGISCKDGVLLVSDKRIVDKLVIADSVEKTFQVDDHIAATAAGIISDARILIDRAQVRAQQHRVTYDGGIDTYTVVREIADFCQMVTQSGGFRPFGVSLIMAGVDADMIPRLFLTDPTGIFFQYNACAVGEGQEQATEILQKKYKTSMTIQDGLGVCIEALKEVLGQNFSIDRIDAAVIATSDRRFKRLTRDEIKQLVK